MECLHLFIYWMCNFYIFNTVQRYQWSEVYLWTDLCPGFGNSELWCLFLLFPPVDCSPSFPSSFRLLRSRQPLSGRLCLSLPQPASLGSPCTGGQLLGKANVSWQQAGSRPPWLEDARHTWWGLWTTFNSQNSKGGLNVFLSVEWRPRNVKELIVTDVAFPSCFLPLQRELLTESCGRPFPCFSSSVLLHCPH